MANVIFATPDFGAEAYGLAVLWLSAIVLAVVIALGVAWTVCSEKGKGWKWWVGGLGTSLISGFFVQFSLSCPQCYAGGRLQCLR